MCTYRRCGQPMHAEETVDSSLIMRAGLVACRYLVATFAGAQDTERQFITNAVRRDK